MTPLKIKIGTAAAALAVGGGFALALPSAPAVAYASPPVFIDAVPQSPAHLVAKGASVSVPVLVTCNTQGTEVQVQLTEKVGNKTATGYNYTQVACTGGHQTILITVPASSNTAFAKGTAYAVAQIFGCAGYYCASDSSSANIQITK